nr:type 4 fimbrial pilin related protein [uncultured bacterium]
MHQQGFTLVEALISLAIVAILVTLGMPYMKNALLTWQLKNAVSDIHFSLIHARSEAIKRNANVTITPSGGWNNGWSIQFGATALKSQDGYPELTITGPAGTITYQRSGRLAATVTDFQVYINGNNTIPMRCVSIGISGTPHTRTDTDGDPGNGCTP